MCTIVSKVLLEYLGRVGLEPVATRIKLAVTFFSVPSGRVAVTVSAPVTVARARR